MTYEDFGMIIKREFLKDDDWFSLDGLCPNELDERFDYKYCDQGFGRYCERCWQVNLDKLELKNEKQMAISDELYKKYQDKQEEAHNALDGIEKQLKIKGELLEKTKDNKDKILLGAEIQDLTFELCKNLAISEVLRGFLMQIFAENANNITERKKRK